MTTEFRFRDCECPGTPHPDGDTVTLRDYLGWDAGARALRAMAEVIDNDPSAMNEKVGPIYLREGPQDWNLVDEDGPLEFDPDAMLELPFEQAYLIADKCDDLYSARVLAPLVAKMNALSAATPTAGTSRTSRSSRRHLKPVAPSSPATSADGKQRAV